VSVSYPVNYFIEGDAVKLVKKILGENKVESVLQRLGRLTLDEARATATQTLEVVHGLVQNMRTVMDGEATLSSLLPIHSIVEYRNLQTARYRQTLFGML